MAKLQTIKSTIRDSLESGAQAVDDLKDEMESWRDNMDGANMSHLPKFDEVSECADSLGNADLTSKVEELVSLLEVACEGKGMVPGCPEHVLGKKCKRCRWDGTIADNSSWLLPFDGRIPDRFPDEPERAPLAGFDEAAIDAPIEWQEYKKRRQSRADRLGNAVMGIETGLTALDAKVGDSTDGEDRAIGELRNAIQEVRESLAELEGIDFPGMFS